VEARQLHQTQQWQAVLDAFVRMAAIEPDCPDPEGLLPAAREEVAAQKALADRYRHANWAMEERRWEEARALLIQIQEQALGFRDTQALLAQAEAEIDRQTEERRRQDRGKALLDRAQAAYQAQDWAAARAALAELATEAPGFQGAAALSDAVDRAQWPSPAPLPSSS
jgi:hypothetical protein